MRVRFCEDWPEAARTAVSATLPTLSDIVPPWVVDVNLFYCRDLHTEPASVSCTPHYATVNITFGPVFLEADEGERRDVLAHEAFHSVTAPILTVAEDMAAEITETNARLGARFTEEVRRANERVASDLEAAFTRLRTKGDTN